MYSVFLYIGILLASVFAAQRIIKGKEKHIPWLTLMLCASLGICFFLQLAYPAVLALFERSTPAIEAGEYWRLITALFFQDGGVRGAISNILLLLLVGSYAEKLWVRRYWLAIYFGTGIAAEFAGLLWQPVGAGNSVAIFGLAASICAYAFFIKTARTAQLISALGVLGAAGLLFDKDIHGAAFYIGLCISACLLLVRSRSSDYDRIEK